MNRQLITSLMATLAIGCATNQGEIQTITANRDAARELNLREIISVRDTIDLDTSTKESYVDAYFSNIVCHDDAIIIGNGSDVLIRSFNYDGTFIGNITTKGRARNELTYAGDIFMKGDTLVICDPNSRKINKYSTSGEFYNSTKFDSNIHWTFFAPAPSGVGYIFEECLFENSEDKSIPRFTLLDDNFNEVAYSEESAKIASIHRDCYNIFDGRTLYSDMFDYHVYQFEGAEIHPAYYVDFGDNAMPSSVLKESRKDAYDYYRERSKIFTSGITTITESEDIVCVTYQCGGLFGVIYDKRSGKSTDFNFVPNFDNMKEFEGIGRIVGYVNGHFVGIHINKDESMSLVYFDLKLP